MTFAFGVTFSTFPLNLVRIGPLVKKWQPIFETQDGGGRIFNVTVAFYVGLSSFPQNLVRIGAIVKKWQAIFEIKDAFHSRFSKSVFFYGFGEFYGFFYIFKFVSRAGGWMQFGATLAGSLQSPSG